MRRSSTGIKGVAARAGVSVGTVSNVLNRPDLVADATRERVLQDRQGCPATSSRPPEV